jgi:S1-C subfamily serine protease
LAVGDVLVEVGDHTVRDMAQLQSLTAKLLADSTNRVPVLVKFDRGRVRYLTVVRIGPEPRRPEVQRSRKPSLSAELQALSPDLAEALGMKGRGGALVTLVYPGHAAERAGLRQGDILLQIDGDPVRCERPEDVEDVYALVRRYRIGRDIECEVWREGAPLTLSLKLEEDLATAEDRERFQDEAFDLTLERLTELDRIHRQLPADFHGVNIAQVETGGWAQLAGLRGNDLVLSIDGAPTPEVNDAETQLKAAAQARSRRVVFFVRRGVHTLFVELEPVWQQLEPVPDPASAPSRDETASATP